MCPKINYTLKNQYKKLEPISTNNLIIEPSLLEISHPFIFNSTDFPEYKKTEIVEILKIPSKWKETFKIKINTQIDYSPCDSIGMLAPNPDKIVDQIFNYCNFKNERLKIERKGLNGFNFDGMLRDFIKYRMDLNSIPKKKLLLELSKNAAKRNELEYLCSVEGTKDYLNLGVRLNTILDIIEEFECKPTVEEIIKYCEIIKPRYYSLIQKDGISEILLGIISNRVDDEIILGHVSNYIKNNYKENSKYNLPIEYCIRKSSLFQGFNSKNIVCFCTGTGIAPFISFYRKYLEFNKINKLKVVYGYRSDEDNLLKYYDVEKSEVILAKSSEKVYVYDFIDEIKDEDCNIFICGNMKMQKSIFLAINEKYHKIVEEKRIFFDNWT